MPIYDYQCSACDATFERLVAGPRTRVICEHCGSRRTQRLPALVGLRGPERPAPRLGKPGAACPPGGCGHLHRGPEEH